MENSILSRYSTYEEMLKNSEQIPLHEFQSMNAEEMPRFAEGLFTEPPGPGLRRKRKKLADFTQDEKQARRKLKNRIAAQSARDRKRIETEMQCKSLDSLQAEVERLREENMSLRGDNQALREDNSKLRKENNELRTERTIKLERDLDRLNYQRSSSGSPNSMSVCINSPTTSNSHKHHLNAINMNHKNVARFDPLSSQSTPLKNSIVGSVPPSGSSPVGFTTNPTTTAVKRPADGLLMSQKEKTLRLATPVIRTTKNIRIVHVHQKLKQETKQVAQAIKTEQTIEQRHQFQKVSAFYTLVLTILFQTASNIVKTRNQNSTSRELNKRLRTIAMIKKIKQNRRQALKNIPRSRVLTVTNRNQQPSNNNHLPTELRSFPQPTEIWETNPPKIVRKNPVELLHRQQQSPPVVATHQAHRHQVQPPQIITSSPNKIPKIVLSMTSCSRSPNPQQPMDLKTLESSTTQREKISLTGGPALLRTTKHSTSPVLKLKGTTTLTTPCPVHQKTMNTGNCLACSIKKNNSRAVAMSARTLNMLNVADHVVRDVTLQVEARRRRRATIAGREALPPRTTTPQTL